MASAAGCRVDIDLSALPHNTDPPDYRYTFSFQRCQFETKAVLLLPDDLQMTIKCTAVAPSAAVILSSFSVLEVVSVYHPFLTLVTQSICAPDLLTVGVDGMELPTIRVTIDVSGLTSNGRICFDLVMRARHNAENISGKARLPLGRSMQNNDRIRSLFFPTCSHRQNQKTHFVRMLPQPGQMPTTPQSIHCRACIAITNERLQKALQRLPIPKRLSREVRFQTLPGELISALVNYLYFGHLPEFAPGVGYDLCAMYACAHFLALTDLEHYCLAELVGIDTHRGGPQLVKECTSTITANLGRIHETLDYRSSLADPEHLIQELFTWAADYDGPCRAICRALAKHHSTECSPVSELMIPHQSHPKYCTVLVLLAQERARMWLP